MAKAALAGLVAYERADRKHVKPDRPVIARLGGATLRDCGGDGPPAILIPSLINPPHILDLDRDVSLADAMAGMGRHVCLLDWGPAHERASLSVSGHVEDLLVPLLGRIGAPAALVGYCLGGTMAIAAANLVATERLVTLATPWNFARYPSDGLATIADLWLNSRAAAHSLNALPMEVLQSAFWSLDPGRTVAKFAKFAALDPDGAEARRFVALEDWANEGEPLPVPAARELIEDFFGANLPGSSAWRVSGRLVKDDLPVPTLHCSASNDRITPAESAPTGGGKSIRLNAGHVGMIGGSARAQLHDALRTFL